MGKKMMENEQQLYLRAADITDMDLLFQWANDSTVRANAFSTAQIPYENHVEWFTAKLKDTDTYIYICMKEDIPIGQVRLDVEGNKAVIDYSISSEQRGHRYGKQMLQLVEAEVQQHLPQIQFFVAEVKKDNTASKKAFLANDFEETFTTYEKTITKACYSL